MPRRPVTVRLVALTGGLLFASLLSCGREITGPDGHGGRAGAVFLDPRYPTIRLEGSGEVLSIGSVVEFDRVRVMLRRGDGSVAVDTLVPFPASAQSISLKLNVTLDPQAPPTGETLSAMMRYLNPAGDTVFAGGPIEVTARPATGTAPIQDSIPLNYVGVGANAKSITIDPPDFTGLRLGGTTFTAIVLDSGDAPLPLAPVAFTSTDSQRVRVDLRTGATSLLAARGGARVIAQTLTGQADTALVTITPVATAVVPVSGANQQTLQNTPFPQPVRVRAVAVDNIGVEGVIIAFDVLQGQGSVSQARDTTDANGDAQVTWTAGDSAGAAILRASIYESVIGLNIGGTQLSDAANNLTFSANPPNITAGGAIPTFSVVVRDITGDTVSSYNSSVQLALSGGTAGANLVGTTTVNALNGVAIFTGLTVDRGGTGYRIVASLPELPGVPPAQTGPFNAAAAPPTLVSVFSGNGQTAPASTPLADSVRFRVTDTFGYAVPGVAIAFAVVSGGGTLSPTAGITDANGRAATRWTLGPGGVQQISATVTDLAPANATATIPPEGGDPVLYFPVDSLAITLGDARTIPVFLTNPTPSNLLVTLTMQDSVAQWNTGTIQVSAGGQVAYPILTGQFIGSTWAFASSAAGTDSIRVTVDSSIAFIDMPTVFGALIGDTVRTLVMLKDPAPAGGLTVTVRSTDSSWVLVAPGTGLGWQEPVCSGCGGLREMPVAPVTPVAPGNLAAPAAGTAVITIPEGAISGHLVIVPVDGDGETMVGLTLEAPGRATRAAAVVPIVQNLTFYLYRTSIGVGQRTDLYAYLDERSRSDKLIRLRSLNPDVLEVDSLLLVARDEYYSDDGYARALSAGVALVEATMPGVLPETLTVTVNPARLWPTSDGATTIALGSLGGVYVNAGYDDGGFFYYGGDRATPLSVTMTSRDPGVLLPLVRTRVLDESNYQTRFDVRAVGVGGTWLVVEAPGHIADSVFMSVGGDAVSLAYNSGRLGVGMVDTFFEVYREGGGTLAAPLTVTLTSSDPSVVRVLDQEVTIPANSYYGYGRLEGRSVGTADITASGAGFTSTQVPVQVFQGAIVLSSFTGATNRNLDSTLTGLTSYLSDGVYSRAASDTVLAVLRSTDPAVLFVVDSIVRFLPGNGSSTGGTFRPVGVGTARLSLSVVTGPAFAGDTTADITVLAPKLNISAASLSIGRGLQAGTSVTRPTSTTGVLNFSVAVQGSSGVTVAATADSFPAFNSFRNILVRSGGVLGTDTVIVSAAGHAPDTLFVQVVGTRASPLGVAATMEIGQQASPDVRLRNASTLGIQQVVDTQRVRLVSRDPAIVEVLSGELLILPGGTTSQAGSVRANAPGSTWIVAEHLSGTSFQDSAQVTVSPPRLFVPDYGAFVMGMQEATYEYDLYVLRSQPRPEPLWVRLTSSNPAVVTVPDSVLIGAFEYYAYYGITSGDTTGSAVITLSADGFLPSTVPVIVSRAALAIYQDDDLGPNGRSRMEVWREAAGFYSYPSTVPIPLRVVVADTTIAKMVPDTVTLDFVDDYYPEIEWLEGRATGTTIATVVDERVGEFTRLVPGSTQVYVTGNRLYPYDASLMHVTPGTWIPYANAFYSETYVDSTWIQLRSVGGRFAVDADSILLEGYGSGYYSLFGLSAGLDTLVASAPGFAPETLLVQVAAGALRAFTTLPANLRQGDSVQVTIRIESPSGWDAYAEPGPLTFTATTTAALAVSVGGVTVPTVVVPAGSNQMTFTLKALAAGGGTLSLTHPDFAPFTIFVGTRSP